MQIITFENGVFSVNTYLVVNDSESRGFILDPGDDIDELLEKIDQDEIKIEAVVSTHGHIDHVAGVSLVKKKYGVPFYINEREKDIMNLLPAQARMFGVREPEIPEIDYNLPESGTLELAGLGMKLLYTPGHSKGSISIYMDGIVFSGDTLFNLSIGRTDLPGGDYGELITAIRTKLFTLPDETRVLSGHGPETTISTEKKRNPFLK